MAPVFYAVANYEVGGFYDEMFASVGQPRAIARQLLDSLATLADGEILNRQKAAERALLQMGITFNVYGEQAGVEKIFPFDILPRIISATEWSRIEQGLKQRIQALNLFLDDIYHDQNDPPRRNHSARNYFLGEVLSEAMHRLEPPRGIWCHVTGTDLVRHGDGQIYVLEDNLRTPSVFLTCWRTGR